MANKKEDGELKVDDLKEIIRSRHEKEKENLSNVYNDIYPEFEKLQSENKLLQDIVQLYRDKRIKFNRFKNQTLIILLLGFALFQPGKTVNKCEEGRISKKVTSAERQLDTAIANFDLTDILGDDVEKPGNIKLGTLLEDYIGIDLEDKKVALLDDLGQVSEVKYQLDCGNQTFAHDDYCLYSISDHIGDIIYIDNPELANYKINIKNGYLYADGEYRMNEELFNSYSLGYDATKSIFLDEKLEITTEDLNSVINTFLKATCYDVLLDHEEKKVDFSLSRIAGKYDYQLPPVNSLRKDVSKLSKVRVKK